MTREQVYETLYGVFQDVFDDESITVHDETTSEDVDGWYSLEHINLITNPRCQTYHVQPRLFLSLRDTFDYIIHHDKTLLKRVGCSQIAPRQSEDI